MIELKPCPCCGGHANIRTEVRQDPPFNYAVWFVECCSCGLRTKDFPTGGYHGLNGTPFMAAYAWNNRRAAHDYAEKVEKGLEACTTGAIGCKGCPYWGSGGGCVSDCMRDAAELIRQLKNGGKTPAPVEG